MSVNHAGIYIPSSVTVYGSDDSSSWTKLGDMTMPKFENMTNGIARLTLPTDVEYRFIRFYVVKTTAWQFIDEVLVYSNAQRNEIDLDEFVDDVYNATTITDEQILSNRQEMSAGKKFDASLGSAIVSKKRPYTVACGEYDWRSGPSDTLLTDNFGVGSPMELEQWVGFDAANPVQITVDLGEVRNDIYGFAVHCYNRPVSDIILPRYIAVEVSQNGEDFYTVGLSYATTESQENYGFRVMINDVLSARYVRFSLPKGNDSYWIEEVQVLGNVTIIEPVLNMYGEFDFVTTDEPSYWEDAPENSDTINLISGLPQQIVSNNFMDFETASKNNAPEETKLLTDGVTTSNTNCYNGYWCQFYRGDHRSIFYDFGNISAVESFKVRILDDSSMGIFVPTMVRLALSENGTDWYVAKEAVPKANGTKSVVVVDETLDKTYRARYAMIYFDVEVHVFIDEISISGKKNIEDASELTSLQKYNIDYIFDDEYIGEYCAPNEEILGGANDVCLIYHNIINANQDYFLPYVGYLNQNGEILDTLFDAYLFLPSTAALPSGGTPHGTNYASDWNDLFNRMFTSGVNFDALNRTAQTVKNTLNMPDYKLKVFVAIPHMDPTLAYFGDIDLDGKNDSLTTVEGRVYVARKYAERVINKFNAMGYKNLELCGFYWFHETIRGEDIDTAIAVNKMFDELNYDNFWIPYFNASSYANWEGLGFDTGCLQPNYAFSLEVDESRLKYASDMAKRYGMSLEIEIDESAFSDRRYFNKYMDYLSGGVKYGYMNDCIHMYYQGGSSFINAYRSSDDRIRLIYDYTYQFTKGTLNVTPNTVGVIETATYTDTAIHGTLNTFSDSTKLYQVAFSPEHGSVTIAENGEFVYYPNKGFSGTDTFSYRISNHLGWSEECTVTVTVEK